MKQIILTIDCHDDADKWDMRNVALDTVKEVFVEHECVSGFKYELIGVDDD